MKLSKAKTHGYRKRPRYNMRRITAKMDGLILDAVWPWVMQQEGTSTDGLPEAVHDTSNTIISFLKAKQLLDPSKFIY